MINNEKSRVRWFGHVLRMGEEIIPPKRNENNQEENLEPDGETKLERI